MSPALIEALLTVAGEIVKHGPELYQVVRDDLDLLQAKDLTVDELAAKWRAMSDRFNAAADAFEAGVPGT